MVNQNKKDTLQDVILFNHGEMTNTEILPSKQLGQREGVFNILFFISIYSFPLRRLIRAEIKEN